MTGSYWSLLIGAVLLAGCGSDRQRSGQTSDTTGLGHKDSAEMEMGGMDMASMRMMPGQKAHVDSMARMSPDRMQTMMSRHETMMSQMLDQMGGDMRQMKMAETPAWSALADSVRQDLAALPTLKAQALSARMRAHASRVQRLMGMHEQMMKAMR
jgi:hypothetical protein